LRNGEIVRALETIATLMEIKGEAYYRVLGYQRAAESVGALGRPVGEVEDLTQLPHVGPTTAEVIRDLAEDRAPKILADLLEKIPPGLVEMTRLPSVGPRTVHTLWKELGVESVEELAELDENQIAGLKGFGKKSAEKILRAARTYNAQERRMLLDTATALGEEMLEFVRSHPSTVRADVAGSLRRKKETIGDLDIVAASMDQGALADAFAEAPFADEVLAHGPK
jgi:DNA polymerase (family 10)